MDFEILGPIKNVQPIATGRGIRVLPQLRERFGGRNWRKMKGEALIRTRAGRMGRAELHWYEVHGVGKIFVKRKRWM